MVLTMEHPLARVLTADEWDALPDTNGLELIDGVVHVMAGATLGHEKVKTRLDNLLEKLLPTGLLVGTEIEVRLSAATRRRPDVTVMLATGVDLRTSLLRPSQVVLAVEVVSTGSETTDRRYKPVDYLSRVSRTFGASRHGPGCGFTPSGWASPAGTSRPDYSRTATRSAIPHCGGRRSTLTNCYRNASRAQLSAVVSSVPT